MHVMPCRMCGRPDWSATGAPPLCIDCVHANGNPMYTIPTTEEEGPE